MFMCEILYVRVMSVHDKDYNRDYLYTISSEISD